MSGRFSAVCSSCVWCVCRSRIKFSGETARRVYAKFAFGTPPRGYAVSRAPEEQLITCPPGVRYTLGRIIAVCSAAYNVCKTFELWLKIYTRVVRYTEEGERMDHRIYIFICISLALLLRRKKPLLRRGLRVFCCRGQHLRSFNPILLYNLRLQNVLD